MRTHVITYLPRGERSATRRLLNAAVGAIKNRSSLDVLDLCGQIPDLFTPSRLSAYIRRDYLGEKLVNGDAAQMAGMDTLTRRLIEADLAILAFPMHNFGPPAIVKAWFDAVMLKGKTWDVGPQGYLGLMKGRKALILCSSGGAYDGTPFASFEHAVSLARCEFQFMGYDPVRSVFAQGMNMLGEAEKEAAITKAEAEAVEAAQELAGR